MVACSPLSHSSKFRMSSISFPNHHRTSDSHEDQFYTPGFDSSSFQINPLSSHPPRTPRTSIVANSSSNTYSNETNEDIPEKVCIDDIEIDEEEEKVKAAEKRIRKEEVWREMFLTSVGRDKAFVSSTIILGLCSWISHYLFPNQKLIQYSIRLGLVFHLSLTSSRFLRRPIRSPLELNILKRLQSTASGLSLTRLALCLTHVFYSH